MERQRQYSLSYLFLEVFWVAAALALATQAFRLLYSPDVYSVQLPMFLASIVCAGAAIGGLFKRMTIGFVATTLVILIATGPLMMLAAFMAPFMIR